MSLPFEDSCDSPKIPLVPYEKALQNLLQQASVVTESESVPVLLALNRILSEDVKSSINVPPADNSSMDGYAIRSADAEQAGPTQLRLTQRIAAGHTGSRLQPGEAARIFTGAPIPDGADAVVMQEQVTVGNDGISFETAVSPGQNIRYAGEDITVNQVILQQGNRLRAQELGLAASTGLTELKVRRRLRVGIFFTGDELVEPGQPLAAGKIYDSNRYTLSGLLNSLDCEIIDLGIVGDTLEQTREAISKATSQADLVITSGGVSVGEEDHVRIALEQLGELYMWRLNIKPGKPLAFGMVNGTAFIGLPGNPVSVFATFCLFVSPFIKKRQGCSKIEPRPIRIIADFSWPRPDRRREFARARLLRDEDNALHADIYANQSSGVLMSTSWADGFVVIPEQTSVEPGDTLDYYAFSDMLG